jgi:hypothetical protein
VEDVLQERIAELTIAEKEAWAQLNFILGRKQEAEDLLARLVEGASEDAPQPLSVVEEVDE